VCDYQSLGSMGIGSKKGIKRGPGSWEETARCQEKEAVIERQEETAVGKIAVAG